MEQMKTLTIGEKTYKVVDASAVKSINGATPDENGEIKLKIESQVEVDSTLTEEGKAADAKATGDRLNELSEEKVDKQQGVENATRLLFVNSSGVVAPLTLGDELSIQAGAGKNIFHGDWENGYFLNTTGAWTKLSSGTSYAGVNKKFPVDKGFTYVCSSTQPPIHDTLNIYISQYDEDYSFLGNISTQLTAQKYKNAVFTVSESTAYISISIYVSKAVWTEITPVNFMIEKGNVSTGYEPYSEHGTERLRVNAIGDALLASNKAAFDASFNYIAYSNVRDSTYAINSVEHFLWAAKQKEFTALKGDVQPTSDGELIMCHDSGFTLNGDGQIKQYDADNCILIKNMTEAECLALKHGVSLNSVCGFETYIRICKQYGKIAFITIRAESISAVVVPKMLAILDKYSMRKRCIINSFSVPSLQAVRNSDPNIMLSNVLTGGTVLTKTHIDTAVALGNCLVTTFYFPHDWFPSAEDTDGDGVYGGFDYLEQSAEALEYARKKDIRVYSAQQDDAGQVDKLLSYGITGAQMLVLPVLD